MLSQTYILYDKAGMVKPTFLSELQQYVNIFSQFTTFCEESNKNPKNFTKNQKNDFQLKNSYTSKNGFSLALRKLDGSPAKFISKEVSIEFLIKTHTKQKKIDLWQAVSCGHLHGFGNTRPDLIDYLKLRFYRH